MSTLDVTGKGLFTVVTGLAGTAWRDAVRRLDLPFLRSAGGAWPQVTKHGNGNVARGLSGVGLGRMCWGLSNRLYALSVNSRSVRMICAGL